MSSIEWQHKQFLQSLLQGGMIDNGNLSTEILLKTPFTPSPTVDNKGAGLAASSRQLILLRGVPLGRGDNSRQPDDQPSAPLSLSTSLYFLSDSEQCDRFTGQEATGNNSQKTCCILYEYVIKMQLSFYKELTSHQCCSLCCWSVSLESIK